MEIFSVCDRVVHSHTSKEIGTQACCKTLPESSKSGFMNFSLWIILGEKFAHGFQKKFFPPDDGISIRCVWGGNANAKLTMKDTWSLNVPW